jgi:tRNA A-37 threonylcarbamoyl transferase component Bud32
MFKKELYIYEKKLPFTPRLLDHDGKNKLILEYLDGQNIGELAEPDFARIAELFQRLHNLEQKDGRCICHRDSNPKNYLLADERYFLIDFSEWEYDFPESDLIHFLLFWASILNRKKFELCFLSFLSSYKKSGYINPVQWEMLIPIKTSEFDSRRMKFGKIESNADIIENREQIKNVYL